MSAPLDERARLSREVHGRVLHTAIWLAIVAAQDLELSGIVDQLTPILVDVDGWRESLETTT